MSGKLKQYFALHLLLMVYSLSGLVSKTAAGVPFLSWHFCLLYAALIALLGVYAIGWQQILKRMDLTTAFSNKAVTVVWGIIWGALFFLEPVTVPKIVGAAMIVVGVVLFSQADVEAAKQRVIDAAGATQGDGVAEAERGDGHE